MVKTLQTPDPKDPAAGDLVKKAAAIDPTLSTVPPLSGIARLVH